MSEEIFQVTNLSAIRHTPYPGDMTSAHDIAAALRDRMPALPAVKLQKLLYYCQGHHLATFGSPLFHESIVAYDMGPVVEDLWRFEKNNGPRENNRVLNEAELNTVGYVLSRYGGMTGKDLARLSHSETPWQRADSNRYPGASSPIHNEWIRDYFTGDGAPEGPGDDVVLNSAEVASFLAGAAERRLEPLQMDDMDELRARLVRG